MFKDIWCVVRGEDVDRAVATCWDDNKTKDLFSDRLCLCVQSVVACLNQYTRLDQETERQVSKAEQKHTLHVTTEYWPK